MAAAYISAGQPKRILVVKPSSLGDIVHALPFLSAVRKCFPSARIDWVVASQFKDLLEGHPMIGKLWVIGKDEWKRPSRIAGTVREFLDMKRAMRQEHYDIAFDLQGLFRSGLIAWASGAPVRVGLRGFKEARELSGLFHTRSAETSKDMHAVERYLCAARLAGCDVSDVAFPLPESALPEMSELKKPYAVIVPGARWQSKQWPLSNFASLAMMMPERAVIIGTKADSGMADEIARLSGGKAVSIAGKTGLKELPAILKNAEYVVTTDSGPMHIASALGVPVFALFGPTSPARTGPFGGKSMVMTAGFECAPCFKRYCPGRKCMSAITPEKVYNQIRTKLENRNRELKIRN